MSAIADRPGARATGRLLQRLLPVVALGLLLVAAVAVRLPLAHEPFLRPHEDDNARYGLAARNHLRLGLDVTRGAPVFTPAGETIRTDDIYLNHPATLPLLLAGVYEVLGESPFTTRLPSIVVSVAGLLVLHAATRRRFGVATALAATAFLALAPGAAWVGRLAVFLPFVLPLGIAAITRHDDEAAKRGGTAGDAWSGSGTVAALTALATLVDWAGLLLVPALAVVHRRGLFAPAAAAAAAVGLHMAHVLAVVGFEGALRLAAHGLGRAGVAGLVEAPGLPHREFSWATLPASVLGDALPYLFTPIGVLLAIAGLFLLVRAEPFSRRTRWVMALLAWGTLYILVFPQAAAVHDYWVYYLLPGFGVLIGHALTRIAAGSDRPSPSNADAGGSTRRGLLLVAARCAFASLLFLIFADQSLRILERRYWNDTGWYRREWRVVEGMRRAEARPGDLVLVRDPLGSIVAQHALDLRVIHAPGLDREFALRRAGPPPKMDPA